MSLVEAKRRLREEMCARRRGIPAAERARAGEAVAQHVLASPEFAAARRVVAYAALADELPTRALLAAVLAAGRELLLPRTREDGRLEFAVVRDLRTLRPGRLSVPEPSGPASALARGDLVLVPGVAFDRTGARLGRGRGCYDRSLPAGADAPALFGLAFAFQLVDRVPRASHDRGVDGVVTEEGLVRIAADRPPRDVAPGPS